MVVELRAGRASQSIPGKQDDVVGLVWAGVGGPYGYNSGQEQSILLTVKIHLVRTKRSSFFFSCFSFFFFFCAFGVGGDLL